MVIRSELERRRAEEQVENLRSELEKIPADEQQDEVSRSIANGLHMQLSDIENELAEYKRLKEGLVPILEADSFDNIGELIIKARIARGWTQGDLAKALEMEQQQVQRYERNDWQKISLWRLQEVVEALGLDVAIRAQFHEHGDQDIEPPQIMPNVVGLYHDTVSTLGLGIGETLGDFGISIGETLVNTSAGISEALGTAPMKISDAVYARMQPMFAAAYRKPQVAENAPQTVLEGDWGTSGDPSEPRFFRLRSRAGAPVITSILWEVGSGEQLKAAHA